MLWLYDDDLIGQIPKNVGHLIYLDTLNLAYNQLTGEIPSSLGDLQNIKYLYLYHNKLNGTISDSICKILPRDISFQIWENQLCPPYPNCISKNSIGAQDTSKCI